MYYVCVASAGVHGGLPDVCVAMEDLPDVCMSV